MSLENPGIGLQLRSLIKGTGEFELSLANDSSDEISLGDMPAPSASHDNRPNNPDNSLLGKILNLLPSIAAQDGRARDVLTKIVIGKML